MSFQIVLRKFCALLVCALLICYAVYEIAFNLPANGCSMTWMYEYPEYIPVRLSVELERKYVKYSLFIYGEGVYADYLRSMKGDYKLEGIPVLFVHGNAGRYKQVRSPASVCLRKSESRVHHFNYFAVDYKEELSALHGPYLYRQTEYLYFAIKRIFECYAHLKMNRPQSLITIGHSMGGLVLRGVLSLPPPSKNQGFLHDKINAIISLASPHVKPPLTLDESIYNFYTQTNQYWMDESQNLLRNVSLLSLGGGVRDYFVRSDLCSLGAISDNPNHVSIVTSGIPLIWLSTDHQCIVWCNELVRGLTRVFFNMIDHNTNQITTNHTERSKEISRVFFGVHSDNEQIALPTDCVLLHVNESVSRYRSKPNSCYKLALKEGSMEEGEVVNVLRVSAKRNWVYRCGKKTCRSVDYDILRHKRKISKFISLTDINQIILKFHIKQSFYIQRISPVTHQVVLPLFLPITSVRDHVETFHCAVHLAMFTESWQVFSMLYYGDTSDLVLQLYVPWTGEKELLGIDVNPAETARLRLHSSRPAGFDGQHVQLLVWTSPGIGDMKLTLTPRISESFARLVHANVELLLRFSLVFGILFKLINVGSGGESDGAQKVCCGALVLMMRLVWFVVSNKNDRSVLPGNLQRHLVIPQLCLMLLSALLCYATDVLLDTMVRVFCMALYPVARMLHNVLDYSSTWFVKASSVAVIATLLHVKVPGCILFAILLAVDLLKHSVDRLASNNRRQVLSAVLPTMLLFNAIPFVVFVKDIMEGFPSQQQSIFFNVTVFVCAYDLYVFSNINEKVDERMCPKLYRHCLLVVCLLGFFPEFIVFYQLTYLSVGYLGYVMLYSFT